MSAPTIKKPLSMPEAATRFGLAQSEYEAEDIDRMAKLEADPATWQPDPDEFELPSERRARRAKKKAKRAARGRPPKRDRR